MIEHTFASEIEPAPTAAEGANQGAERYDFASRVDALRCHSSDALRRIVADARVEQQRWRMEELAALRVLDDREALRTVGDPAVDPRRAKANLAAARALETQPAIAAATYAGELSWEQTEPLLRVATPETDREWAARGRNLAPVDIERMARERQRVTLTDAAARRDARFLRTWRDRTRGMADGRWSLPDLDGVLVDKVLDHMAEHMRPARGLPWDSLEHRKADALVELARRYADAQPTGRFRIEIVNIVDARAASAGPEVEGISLATEQVSALLPRAKVRDCVADPETGLHRTVGAPRKALPADVERHVRRRDTHCRVPGCTNPVHEIHHCEPVCVFGETTDVRTLVGVCTPDHRILEPHGPYRLVGNAEEPDGLRLVHRDDIPPDRPPDGGGPPDRPADGGPAP